MKFCLSIEIQEGLDYAAALAMTRAAEDSGFDAALLAEHYYPSSGLLDRMSAEAWVFLGALARDTTRIRLGSLVSPVTFRPPAVLAKLAATLDHLTNGRAELGIGAGWLEAEHSAFGEHGSLEAILAEAAEIERTVAAAKAEASLLRSRGAAGLGASAESSVTRALVGDLTLLHDAGSLALTPGEPRPRLLVIVGDDGGGTIFDSLEVAASAPVDAFDRVQYTPHAVDFASLAAAYGGRHLRATTRGELEEALATRIDGPTLLEVPLAR